MGIDGGDSGVYLRRELIAGIGRKRVDAELRRGRLRPLWAGVLIDTHRALDVTTRAAGALLMCGPRAAICGPTAAWLHGCTAADTADTHVLVPYGHWARRRPGLAVHNGPLPEEQIIEFGGLRVLCLERVISDVLCTVRPRDALAITDQAMAGQTDEAREGFRARVSRLLTTRADWRGRRRGLWLLELATGRAESPPESWLLLEIVELNFPIPEANWCIHGPDGVLLYRLDLAWPELRIALEYNGYAVHAGREVEDAARAEDLRQRGWIVITVTKADLADSRRLEAALRDAFRRRGYEPAH